MMKFRTYVEPPEPMRGLEVPPEVVEALGGGKRPAVTITINGHSWQSRVAIMRGRYLLGLSNANRKAASVVTGDQVEVEVDIDAAPRAVAEPADFARAGADFHFVVHNAAGMVSVQEGISVTEALIRLRAFAFSSDRLLADVAEDVVARRLRLG
jgi:hypothetical protein